VVGSIHESRNLLTNFLTAYFLVLLCFVFVLGGGFFFFPARSDCLCPQHSTPYTPDALTPTLGLAPLGVDGAARGVGQ
jgi:hypothetical protein